MNSKSLRRRSNQLMLVPPTAPLRWIDLPTEARTRVVRLLARLLREHRRVVGTEVRDE